MSYAPPNYYGSGGACPPPLNHPFPYPSGPQEDDQRGYPAPYKNQSNSGYPGQSPYPPTQLPYPPTQCPYPPTESAYPPTQCPYPSTESAYPPTESSYPPPPQCPYPPIECPYLPPPQCPYPPIECPYPPTKSPYPPNQSPYPPTQSPYPPTQSQYSPNQSPYPSTKTTYPSAPSAPSAPSSYPVAPKGHSNPVTPHHNVRPAQTPVSYEQKRAKAIREFERYDSNHSGRIVPREFIDLIYNLASTRLAHDDVRAIYNLIDTNGDGTISKEEFISHYMANY